MTTLNITELFGRMASVTGIPMFEARSVGTSKAYIGKKVLQKIFEDESNGLRISYAYNAAANFVQTNPEEFQGRYGLSYLAIRVEDAPTRVIGSAKSPKTLEDDMRKQYFISNPDAIVVVNTIKGFLCQKIFEEAAA